MFGGHFDQLLVQFLRLVHLVGGNLQLLAVAVVVLETVHLHQQYVDEGVELRPLVDGVLYDDGLHARCGPDRLDRGFEIGFLGIELVHHADDGLFQQACIAGLDLAADFPSPTLNAEKRLPQKSSEPGQSMMFSLRSMNSVKRIVE